MNRRQRRQFTKEVLSRQIPSEVDIVISKLAEFDCGYTKEELKGIYVTEPDYRKGRALRIFRELIAEFDAKEPEKA